MNEEETFLIAFLFSSTGVFAHFSGVDLPEWIFPVSAVVLMITISLALLPILVRMQPSGLADDEKPKSDSRSASARPSHEDQKAIDRKAMEELIDR